MVVVRAVMFFAGDPRLCCDWWSRHLGDSAVVHEADGEFCWFESAGLEIGFHPSDDQRNPTGGSPVVYFHIDDLGAARSRLLAAGAAPHRGPLMVEQGRRICQLVDPFGNIFGLDGP